MAEISVKVPRRQDWGVGDRLRLYRGSENAASLATSTPAGGTLIAEVLAWPHGAMEKRTRGCDARGASLRGFGPGSYARGTALRGYGLRGVNDAPPAVLRFSHDPADVDATLPVGVMLIDAAGNESVVFKKTVQLADAPDPVTSLAVAATANASEAQITWTASRHVS